MNNTPLEIKQLLMEKRKARALWQRTHFPANKTRYNQLTDKPKAERKEMREASFTDYIHNLSRHDCSIWKHIKNIRKSKEFSPPICTTTSTTGPWMRSNKEKSELFAQHFANIFTLHNEERDQEIEKNIAAPIESQQTLPITTPKEIKEVIKSLRLKKAPRLDQVTPQMLKELPRKGIVILTYILNGILRISYWPKQFKISQIITIPKPGKDATEITSYCPISLISVLSKVF
jgi:hypothetical protein